MGSPWAQGIDTARFALPPSSPLGAMGAMGSPWVLGHELTLPGNWGWQGPVAPLPGGENTLWERLCRGMFPLLFPWVCPPGMAPKYSGTIRGSRRAIPGREGTLESFYRFL